MVCNELHIDDSILTRLGRCHGGFGVLEAAKQIGTLVPHYCYHPGMSSPAMCRLCLVEVEGAPQSFSRREVKLGLSDGINVEILSGIDQSTRVKKPHGESGDAKAEKQFTELEPVGAGDER